MADPTLDPSTRKPGYVAVLALVGTLLWTGGTGAALFGLASVALVLRCAGILLISLAILRRPSLLGFTFLAMLAGVELGLDLLHFAAQTRFLADLFLRLIRMIVAPLIFATITIGIAAHSQLRSIGCVVLKAIVYFEVVTTLGLIIGLVVANLSGAGWGVNLLLAEARESCAHIFLIFGWMVCKVGNGLLNCHFHDLPSESLVPKHRGCGSLCARPVSFNCGTHRRHNRQRTRRVLHGPAAV